MTSQFYQCRQCKKTKEDGWEQYLTSYVMIDNFDSPTEGNPEWRVCCACYTKNKYWNRVGFCVGIILILILILWCLRN